MGTVLFSEIFAYHHALHVFFSSGQLSAPLFQMPAPASPDTGSEKPAPWQPTDSGTPSWASRILSAALPLGL